MTIYCDTFFILVYSAVEHSFLDYCISLLILFRGSAFSYGCHRFCEIHIFSLFSVSFRTCKGLDLRVEHTHGFSHHGEGGHYYIDTTPDTVEYQGYFLPAEFIYRIDRPKDTHKIGRD